MAPVGAVVLSFNRRELTLDCLASLLGLGIPPTDLDVVVVDNASTDGTVDAVRARWPSLDVVANAENVGFGRGMDAGVARLLARGCEDVLLLNNDTRFPDRDFLTKLRAAFAADPEAALAGPRVVSLESGRVLFGGPARDRYGPMPVTGAALLVRGAWVRALGVPVGPGDGGRAVYDPAFFLYFEDRDLFRRVEASGWRAVHVDDAVVAHSEASPSSGGHLSAMKLHHWNRSFMLFARKHLSGRETAAALAADRLRILPWQTKEMLARRDGKAFRAYWSGYAAGWRAARADAKAARTAAAAARAAPEGRA